ncbi:MAG: uracil-DNA glycosylase [Lentimicrobium sp.]|nr:uracil-DNA glycosylase [Lentimicrobium sp.]MDD2528160.1 uracil-DNA glycosylase [Lentimicrobiaceae bacterium]MDD4598801.1 uracil-DNA glycosylase [Lentimicrobiaceae bacterium]MDY0026339.1 uracil-DNA glycosylase [Lentimicrobium sp.]HAH58437.1 uracil-DNA glycosylase [Bacteroidales bacterium]
MNPVIEESWKKVLGEEFDKPYFRALKSFLVEEKQRVLVYPPGKNIFEAFNRTPFHNVKVVILGQDPYHGAGQAHGLCFSVPGGVAFPPSLQNIFRELQTDLDIPYPKSGNLSRWADQGVLLLNATLTVRANQAGSHQKQGWESFTDGAIQKLSEQRSKLVFLLWGKFAQNKKSLIDLSRHYVLEAPHPSPLSVYRGFFGCAHFSKANRLLVENGIKPIDWNLP